jgi:2-iminobutanoate/2-iminopropanoate deaminase
MPKQEVRSEKLAEPNGHFAQAVVAATGPGRMLFISGMTARNNEGGITGLGDIKAQTRQVCENVQAAVEAAGGTMDDIVRVDVYVTDMRHFDAIHEVRREFFTGTPPASTMVEISKFSRPGYEIEMNAIAVLP